MAAAISDLLVTLFITSFGIALGWYLRAFMRREEPAQGRAEETNPEVQRAKEVLDRLQELAASVAADVGQHSQRVEQINEELSTSNTPETEKVVGAVTKLLQTNRQMQHRLASAEERLQEQARQIETQATAARTDALTGLANRRALDDVLARRLFEFQQLSQPFWMMMLDVDHFKRFNDTHGHQAGDEVLRGVARVLRANAQTADLVARYGGEELVVVFAAPLAAATQKADRIRQAIEDARFRFEGIELRVTVSVGIAEIAAREDVAGLLRRADEALYTSKNAGRNCAHWHDGRKIHRIGGEVRPAPENLSRQVHSLEVNGVKASPASGPVPVSHSKSAKPATPAPTARTPRAPEPATPPLNALESRFQPQPGLANRTAFCTVVSSRLAEWRRGGVAPGTLLLQVDHYAEIAARGDHQLGNLILRSVVNCLTATLREMDMVAQYDEAVFAVVLPGAELPVAIRVAERLRLEITQCMIQTEGGVMPLTVSVGGAEAITTDDGASLLRRTAEALDAASRSGGNCCYFHNGQWSETAAAALERATASPTARG